MATNKKFRVKHGLEVNTLSGSTTTLVFPTADGTSGQVIQTDGSGNLSFITPSYYTDADVDTHLNTSTANANEVLSWSGSDYDWTAISTNFLGLTDVSETTYTNNGGKIVQVNSAGTALEFGGVTLGQSSRDSFTGDGTTTAFTLTQVYAGQNDILVFVDGVIQYPGNNFTLSGTTLTFTSAPVNSARIEAFGTTPLTTVNIPGDGTVTAAKLAASAYTRDIFTGNGSTAAYNLTGDAGSPLAPFVFVGGILQDPSTHYTIDVLASPQTITFTSNLPNGTEAVVVYGPVSSTGIPSDGSITFQKMAPSVFNYDTFTGDGTTTAFTLSQSVLEAKHLLVTVAAVMQTPQTAYTATGTTLTFTSAPANGAPILVRYYVGASLLVPTDNSVSTVKIQNSAVTSAKIADGTITKTDLAFNPEDDAVALAIALG